MPAIAWKIVQCKTDTGSIEAIAFVMHNVKAAAVSSDSHVFRISEIAEAPDLENNNGGSVQNSKTIGIHEKAEGSVSSQSNVIVPLCETICSKSGWYKIHQLADQNGTKDVYCCPVDIIVSAFKLESLKIRVHDILKVGRENYDNVDFRIK